MLLLGHQTLHAKHHLLPQILSAQPLHVQSSQQEKNKIKRENLDIIITL